ncbi:MAG TPA: hypothetical protein VND93_31220, partial [Myxococcales bacterium]|nr:hypothetical protein [Myxococcales bacterium]
MTPGRAAAAAALVLLGAGCPGPQVRWAAAAAPPGALLAVPPGAPVVGLGAKVSPRGFLPARCLEKAERSAQG